MTRLPLLVAGTLLRLRPELTRIAAGVVAMVVAYLVVVALAWLVQRGIERRARRRARRDYIREGLPLSLKERAARVTRLREKTLPSTPEAPNA